MLTDHIRYTSVLYVYFSILVYVDLYTNAVHQSLLTACFVVAEDYYSGKMLIGIWIPNKLQP